MNFNVTVISPLNGERVRLLMIPESRIFFGTDGNVWMRYGTDFTAEVVEWSQAGTAKW
jgi:hypothetical protein